MSTGTLSTDNVSVGKPMVTGGAYVAFWDTLTDADIPTNATDDLSDAFTNAGYISEDGLTNSTSLDGTDPVLAWGGTPVVLPDGTKTETYQLALIESKLESLQAVYGRKNVTEVDGQITVRHNATGQPLVCWVYEIALSSGKIKRIVVPKTKLTDLDDVQYTDTDVVAYNGTYTAIGAEVFDGDTSREFIADLPETVAVTGVSVTPDTESVAVGATAQLTATVIPDDATNTAVAWSSSNEDVATVSSTGEVTGVAAGSATITATTDDGSKTDSADVTVTAE